MQRTRVARRIVALGLFALCALPWRASGQAQNSGSDAAARAAGQAWFREYIEPVLAASSLEKPLEQGPALYDPNEAAPMPGKPIPERRLWQHRARVDSVALVVWTGDLPPTRSERLDARDWYEPVRYELYRFWFEPVPPVAP